MRSLKIFTTVVVLLREHCFNCDISMQTGQGSSLTLGSFEGIIFDALISL